MNDSTTTQEVMYGMIKLFLVTGLVMLFGGCAGKAKASKKKDLCRATDCRFLKNYKEVKDRWFIDKPPNIK